MPFRSCAVKHSNITGLNLFPFCIVEVPDLDSWWEVKNLNISMQDEEKLLKKVNELLEEQQRLKDRLSAHKSELTKSQNEVEEFRKMMLTLNR